jgi:hypothetical protein
MRQQLVACLVVGAIGMAAEASADVVVKLANGHASVSATNATVREILAEWARVGHARIVNVERVGGAPVTMELNNVPELQALDVILRSVSGYVAAPRADAAPDAAQYDRIYLLATSTPAAAPPRLAPAVAAQPAFPPPAVPAPDEQEDDVENARPGGPARPAPPIRAPFPQPRQFQPPPVQQQPQGPASYPTPTSPFGVATPGMPVPVPQQPGQPQPGQPDAQPR